MIHDSAPFKNGGDVRASSASNPEIEALQRSLEEERRLRFELQHRVSNNLMGLIGLIELVTRTVHDPERRLEYVSERLRALMAAHHILTQRDEGTIRLRDLIESLIPAAAPGRVDIDCQNVAFAASRGAKLALVINEWFINSTKYGALTTPDGVVTIRFTHDENTDTVHGQWIERGGPPLNETPQPGLGTMLLRQLVESDLGGEVSLGFAPDGAEHELTLVRDPKLAAETA